MFANLADAAAGSGGFPVVQLITLVVVVAVLYPVQKRLRAAASRQRRERWEREGLLEPPPPEAPGPTDASAHPGLDPEFDDRAETAPDPLDSSSEGDDHRPG